MITCAKIERLCLRAEASRHPQRNATRIWNAIDNMPFGNDPNEVVLWDTMAATIPWAFSDVVDTNSIRFQYA